MTVAELLAKLGLDTTEYERGLARMERQTQAAGTRLGNILEGALSVTIGIGFFEAIRRGFQTVVGEAVSFNAMMEQARIGFTTMLGSAERAQAFLDEMADFAARTPFEYPDLLDAAKRMMAMGFAAEEVLPTLQAVGDAAAGLGLGREGINRITLALGQMRAKAKVSGEEMRQLTEAGIPAWEILAEAVGKSTAEVMKLSQKGLIPAGQAIQWLVEGMEKRFPNMMQNMENTWEGVTSTIKDVWRMTVGALTSNLFNGITQWLQKVRDFATEFYTTFRRFGLQVAITRMFGPEFATAVSIATSALRGLWSTTRTVLGGIVKYWAIIKPLVIGAVTAFLSFKLVTWVLSLAAKAAAQFTFVTAVMRGEAVASSAILNVVARAVQIYRLQLHLASLEGIKHIGILQSLRIALYSVWSAMGPIGWAILGITAAVTAGITLWSKYAASVERANLERTLAAISGQETELGDTSQQAAEGLGEQADATKQAGKAAKDNLQPFDEINRLMGDTAEAAEDITAGLDQIAMPGLEAPGEAVLPKMDIAGILEAQKPTLAGFWDWLKQGAANLWDGVKQKWNGFLDWVKSWGLWNWLKEKWNAVGMWAAGIWDGVKQRWASFKEWVLSWAGPLWDGIKQKWGSFVSWAGSIWDTVKSKWSSFAGWVGNLWDDIRAKAGDRWQKITKTVLDWWDDLKQGISARWNNISSAVSGWWDGFKTLAGTKWQSIVSTVLTWWDNLRQNIAAKWGNINSYLGSAWDSFRGTAGSKWGGIKDTVLNAWQNMKTGINNVWSSILSSASSYGSSIASTIRSKLEQAWSYIKSIPSQAYEWGRNIIRRLIDGLKALHIPTPHFSFSVTTKTIAGLSIPVPDIDVRWYAQGGIFTQPSVIGVGEAGPEAVLPLSDTSWMDRLAERITAALRTTQLAGAGDIYVYIGNEQVEAYIYRAQERRTVRANGR